MYVSLESDNGICKKKNITWWTFLILHWFNISKTFDFTLKK